MGRLNSRVDDQGSSTVPSRCAAMRASMCVYICMACCLRPMLAGQQPIPPQGASTSIRAADGTHEARRWRARALEDLLRLRGGKDAAATTEGENVAGSFDEAVHILNGFSPRKKVFVVRGAPKQARDGGFRPPKERRTGHPKEKRGETKDKKTKEKKKKKKLKLHEQPWRWQAKLKNLEGDVGFYRGRRIEVRKRTSEGNHILRIGFVGSRRSREMHEAKMQKAKEEQEGLWERQTAVQNLKEKIARVEEGSESAELGALKLQLGKLERELIRYKDQVLGTSVWKNLTAHTVPMWLRQVNAYDPIETDEVVYKQLERARKIVFNPSLASTATEEELLELQTFFMEKGMVPHVQRLILRTSGVKPLLLLGTIGGGKHVWRGDEHWNPFGKRFCAGGPLECNAALVSAGCRMLMGVTRANAGLRFRFWRLDLMKQMVKMGLLMLEGGHVDALWATLQALAHFAHARNEETSDMKPGILREGGLELLVKSMRTHPLHFGIKREGLEFALGMITGRSSRWKAVCKDAVRASNVTGVARWLCDVRSHGQGGKRTAAIHSLAHLERKLGLEVSRSVKDPTRKLTRSEVKRLREEGCLPQPAASAHQPRSSPGTNSESDHDQASTETDSEDKGVGGERTAMLDDGPSADDGTLESALQSLRKSVSRLRGGAEGASDLESDSRAKANDKKGASGKKKGKHDSVASGEKRGKRGGVDAEGKHARSGAGQDEVMEGGVKKKSKKMPKDAMIFRHKCMIRKTGNAYCFAVGCEPGGTGENFYIRRSVLEKNSLKKLFVGDVVLVTAIKCAQAASGNATRSHVATRVTLVLRNNTGYLTMNGNSTQGTNGVEGRAPGQKANRDQYQCTITSWGPKFAFADGEIFISKDLRETCGIRALFVGDIVSVNAMYNPVKKTWVASHVQLVRRNNTGYLAKKRQRAEKVVVEGGTERDDEKGSDKLAVGGKQDTRDASSLGSRKKRAKIGSGDAKAEDMHAGEEKEAGEGVRPRKKTKRDKDRKAGSKEKSVVDGAAGKKKRDKELQRGKKKSDKRESGKTKAGKTKSGKTRE